MKLREMTSISKRRKFIEEKVGKKLDSISIYPKHLEDASRRNCENMIGTVQIPLGIAGPLTIQGTYAKGEYYLPLATSEGALVASLNRGCKAICQGGGVIVHTENAGMSRGAIFETGGIRESFGLKNFILENKLQFERESKKTSSHIALSKIDSKVIGRNLYVRFSFDTQDAMGMNMVTIATQAIAAFIEKKTGLACLALAGNFDVDKKASWLNAILGRGRCVWAEAILSSDIIAETLKTTPQKIHRVAVKKCLVGGAISGSIGFNAHFANVIAAIFIACGQDAAHIVEGSIGITTTEVVNTGLSISIHLPDLPIGTVGGGTGLPSQSEALSILGLEGGDKGSNAAAFAEIVGAAILAGELSLLASLSEGSLASAHKRLTRGNA